VQNRRWDLLLRLLHFHRLYQNLRLKNFQHRLWRLIVFVAAAAVVAKFIQCWYYCFNNYCFSQQSQNNDLVKLVTIALTKTL
jgi:hypothetical protein